MGGGPADDALELARRMADRLARSEEEELRRGHTLSGPHRDELELLLDDRPARSMASRGEARLASLALLLGQAEWIHRSLGIRPVLLLDDVDSELDPARRASLLAWLRERGQALVTSTRPPDPGEAARRFRVQAGQIILVNSGGNE